MRNSRLLAVLGLDFSWHARRPIVWVLLALLLLTSWGLSTGSMRISSGDSAVGGTKAWLTSEFNNGKMLPLVIFIFYIFFITILAGLSVVQDEERKVGEILHSTPLHPSEYIWGKFLAVAAASLAILTAHLAFAAFFNHLVPNPNAEEVRGPFHLVNYARPAVFLGLPGVLFIAGATFAIGERSRRPILVFVLPLAALLFCAFFLWSWTPSWLDPRWNRLLMLLDPAGVRWMSETWLEVDRGVEFYNTQPVGYDAPFLLSRLAFAALGVLAVAWSARGFGRTLRGGRPRGLRTAVEGERAAEILGETNAVPDSAAIIEANPDYSRTGVV